MNVRLSLPLALVACTAIGCANEMMMGAEFDDALAQDIVSGQTLVFVGTDPATLTSDVYLVRAVSPVPFSGEEAPPDLREAQEFTVDPLDVLTEGANGSVVQTSETLFPAEAPFVVPDEEGLRVLATSLTYDEQGGVEGGRLLLITITPRLHEVSPFIPGLQSARFTWGGDHLVLQLRDPETGRSYLEAVHVDDIERDGVRFPVGPPAPAQVEFAEPLREEEAFLAMVTNGYGDRDDVTDVVRIDPLGGPDQTLTLGTTWSSASPRISGDGTMLAVTLRASDASDELPARSIGVFDLTIPDSAPRVIAGNDAVDCGRMSWSPHESAWATDMLAFACRNLGSGRPDVHVWRASLPDETPIALTATSQTAVPGGSVDDLVMRSEPQWDPSGVRLVFGASTEQEALDGMGMTVLAFELTDEPLDTQIAQAYPVYPSTNGAADWVHFSAGSSEPILMLWDRTQTGLEDTRGGHAIEVVSVAREGGAPRPVELGRDLAVSYPVFLGRNTLFYR